MNKIASRITAAVMAASMMFSFSSCKEKEVYASKENMYKATQVELSGERDYINRMFFSDNKFYIIAEKSESSGEGENYVWSTETLLQIIDLEGNLVSETSLVKTDSTGTSNRYIANAGLDNEGNLVLIENEYSYNESTGESHEENFVKKMDKNGTLISETSLKGFSEAAMKESGNDWFYIDNFIYADDGTMIVTSNGGLYAADANGGLAFAIKPDNLGENAWLNGLYRAGDGRIFTYCSAGQMIDDVWVNEVTLYEIDLTNKKLGTAYPVKVSGSFMNGTDEYDLLITRDSGMLGYDIETGKTEMIIDWLKSGFDTTAMEQNGTTVLPDGRIVCLTYDYDFQGGGYSWSNDDLMINVLTKVDPSEVPDKKLIKLYALYLDIGVKRQIIEFNKTNELYEIELTSYEDYAINSYDEALTKMNNDMISGNIPDIIVLDTQLPIDSYISKGLLADLYEFMEKDESFNRADYLENIFKAYEVDGKLYELVPTFNVRTLIGKTSFVGDKQGWTVDEFISLVEANPEMNVFNNETTRDGFFEQIIAQCYTKFINVETGECSFNSDDFVKLMEFANRFPKEIDWEDDYHMGEAYWQDQEVALREDKALFMQAYIGEFAILRQYEKAQFGAPITLIGYPGAEGNGSAINANTELAITANAANPDGAWEFVKYFLSDEYQDQISYNFPIKLSSLNKQMEKAKERPYWEDENGNKEYYDNSWWIAGQEIKIGENTDEDNQRMLDFIKSVTTKVRYDQDVLNIIKEESAAFFEGQKSAKDVADIIQNRVSNYIAENS